MPDIPSTIDSVTVEFKGTVNKSVDQRVVDALKHVIKTDIASGHTLDKIYISSANDSHSLPSRHVQGNGKAVDISRINGKKMSVHYPSDATVKAITKAIQEEFESYTHRRENYGPFLKKKLGVVKAVSGHNDHIHLSVN